jgi:hypothetical protein
MINLRNCYLTNGTIFSNGTCDIKNLVENLKFRISHVKYLFEYLNPVGITNASLDIYFLNPPSSNEPFYRQDFEITFSKVRKKIKLNFWIDFNFFFDILNVKKDNSNVKIIEDLKKLSGNPGYIKGFFLKTTKSI